MSRVNRTQSAGVAPPGSLFGLKRWALVGSITLLVVVLDQLSKSWAQSHLASHSISLFGPLKLKLEYNTGFAFSLGRGHPYIIALFVLFALAVLAYATFKVAKTTMLVGIALLAGGALGNFVDRIFRNNGGGVIDFIYLRFWPTFNIADAAVVLGVAVIAFGLRHKP